MKTPRFLLCATGSGSGKTTVTCGLLQALKERGLRPAAFKCGPDYIDPMFHSTVIGAKSRNIDTFFSGDLAPGLMARAARDCDISVIEGVMGYYDGIADSTDASTYDVAVRTKTPAVLLVNAAGMSVSAAAIVKGFVQLMPESMIRGVILNKMAPSIYPEIKAVIEEKTGVWVYGYVPKLPELMIESRHLGLVRPEEVEGLREKLHALAGELEKTVDVDGLLALAATAPDIDLTAPDLPQVGTGLRIAVARDEAFCFYYEDNMTALRDMGAEIVEFSPIREEKLPENCQGLLLGGGYPELHAQQLSENEAMRRSVCQALAVGMPCIAECGGFMYLHETVEYPAGMRYPMCGVIPGMVYYTGKLGRFGYIELTANEDSILGPAGTKLRGHEFHYFDSTDNGEALTARKPRRKRNWQCAHARGNLLCGFPHLYFYSNPNCAQSFLEACAAFGRSQA